MKRLNQNNDINNIKIKKHSFITAQLVVWLLVMLCCFAVVYATAADKRKASDENDAIYVSNATSYTATAPDQVDGVYEISSFENLLYVYLNYATYSEPTFNLTADITVPDMTGGVTVGNVTLNGWCGIGYYDNDNGQNGANISGWKFDGGLHTITFKNARQGLFHNYSGGTICNLGIKGNIACGSDDNIYNQSYGAICGYAVDEVTIDFCYNSATISAVGDGVSAIGGLVGVMWIQDENIDANIQYSYNYGLINPKKCDLGYAGGVVGLLDMSFDSSYCNFLECYNMGTILASTDVYIAPLLCYTTTSYIGEMTDCYYLNGCVNADTSDNDILCNSGTSATPTELKSIFSNDTTNWTQSSNVNGGYPYLTDLAPTTKWLTLKLGTGYTINGVSGEYAIGMDAGQTIDLSTLNISPTITSANLSKTSGGGTLSGTTYTFGSTDGVVTVSAATYTVTIEVNNSSYGSVSTASVTSVAYGTSITSSNNVLTIGSTKVTASPKTSNSQYTYSFNYWSGIPSGGTIVGNTTITANFKATTKTYTVTIEVNDSSYGSVSQTFVANVPYGTTITTSGSTVTINGTKVTATAATSTSQYSYAFSSWTNGTATVTGATTVTANFTRETNSYTVSIKANNSSYGSVNKTSVANVPYGTKLTTSGSTVTINGTKVTATAATSTAQYSYAFKDWTNGTATVTGATTVTANFTREINSYTVTIKANDSSYGSVSQTSVANVPYGTTITTLGSTVTINGTTVTATPTTSTAQYSYAFKDWTNGTATVTGATTVTANFTRETKTYTVSIKANNSSYGSVSKTSVANVPYGTTITTSGSTVTINGTKVTATAATSTSQYSYAFSSWTNGTATVTGATTVTANFTRETKTYTVTIKANNDSYGSVSSSSVTVDYGTSITSSNNVLTIGSTKVTATPKSSDGQYSYKFSKWIGIPSGSKVVGNVTVTANFTATEESHSLTITLQSNTEREYIVYILGSNGNPTRQLVMKNGDSYTIEGLNQGEKFSILVAETLYTKCTIKDTTANTTEQTRKKTYESGVSANTNIEITISGAGNVNNWAVV